MELYIQWFLNGSAITRSTTVLTFTAGRKNRSLWVGFWTRAWTTRHGLCFGSFVYLIFVFVFRFLKVLFDVPDIRLFWSKDSRFLSQFSSGKYFLNSIVFLRFLLSTLLIFLDRDKITFQPFRFFLSLLFSYFISMKYCSSCQQIPRLLQRC